MTNLRRDYDVDYDWWIAFIELISNCMDAKATLVKINFIFNEDGTINFIISDNGIGMSFEDLVEYHTMGGIVKSMDSETIGINGLGAKMNFDQARSVLVETTNGVDYFASIWQWKKDALCPSYDDKVKSEGLVKTETGTVFEFSGFEIDNFSVKALNELILKHFQFAMPPYGEMEIEINGKKVQQPKLKVIESSPIVDEIKRKRKKIKTPFKLDGELFLYEKELENPGVSIIVYGKTIESNHYFDLGHGINPEYKNRIGGYIRCDQLKPIVRITKDAFFPKHRRGVIWTNFHQVFSDHFKKWLMDIDAWSEDQIEFPSIHETLLKRWDRKFNDLIITYPELVENIPAFPMDRLKPTTNKSSGIKPQLKNKSDINTETGIEDEAYEITESIKVFNIENDEKVPEKKPIPNMSIISIVNDLDRIETSWWEVNSKKFVINSGAPAFQYISKLGKKILDYYLPEQFILCIQDTCGLSKEEIDKIRKDIYQYLLSNKIK